MMLGCKVGIVTGGPGTGKSTLISEFLKRAKNKNIALCAPTGKAAKRIIEVTQHSAMTIHRLLGATSENDHWVFSHGPDNFLTYDTVVVDEASMIDAELCDALLKAINPHSTSVFFIGDANQLPSVGPGQVFADLINSGMIPVSRLEHVHRAAAESWVCRNAPYILNGDIDITTPAPDFRFISVSDPEVLARRIVDLVTVKMPKAGCKDIQVMSPQNGGSLGVETLNNYMQTKINPTVSGHEEDFWKVKANKGATYKLREKDLVLATQNDYNRFVFNGEIGTITKLDTAAGKMIIDFDSIDVEYDYSAALQLRLAYALTVHKCQGGQWDWVVVVCHSDHSYMWSRSLLYTAVTRAKKGVVLIGNTEGISSALENDESATRITTLKERLLEDDKKG